MKNHSFLALALLSLAACTHQIELPVDWREQNMKNIPNENFISKVGNLDPNQTFNVADMNPLQWATGVEVVPVGDQGIGRYVEPDSVARNVMTRATSSGIPKTPTDSKVADFFAISEGNEVNISFLYMDAWAVSTVGLYYYKADGSMVKCPIYEKINGKSYAEKGKQPVLPNVPVKVGQGTCFGLYIESSFEGQDNIFYSESRLNDDKLGHVTLYNEYTTSRVYNYQTRKIETVKTYTGQYIGFEDTPGTKSDRDFNDFMIRVNTQILEGQIPLQAFECDGGPWMILCEDLGTGADNDFNDIVYMVSRPSSTQAMITYMAGGSTILDYVLFNSKAIGEIHEVFGVDITDYDENNKPNWFINTKMYNDQPSTSEATWAQPVQSKPFAVDESLTMANFYRTNPNNFDEGFSVKNMNSEVPFSPTYVGYAPYVICVPAQGFRWPRETVSIFDAYPEFEGWARDHTKNTDWYKHPVESKVVDLDAVLASMNE